MIVRIRSHIRELILKPYFLLLTKLYKMDISPTARISLGARLDKTNPTGIHIGDESYVTSGAIVFSHDFTRFYRPDTYIGKRCFIGANAIVMPGVTIGDNCIVGSGAVVTKDVASGCIVAGNPARVIREGITTTTYGRIVND